MNLVECDDWCVGENRLVWLVCSWVMESELVWREERHVYSMHICILK